MKILLKRFIVEKDVINSIKIILHQEHVNVHIYEGFICNNSRGSKWWSCVYKGDTMTFQNGTVLNKPLPNICL